MSKCVFLSYIIPCYNVERYLPKCLESLANQIISDNLQIEFIFVNDGSKDGTLQLLREFAAIDDRAKIIDQNNQGVSVARNNGLKQAIGDYVFFLDGDDFLTKEASQLVYDVSKKNSPDIIIPNAYYVIEGDESRRRDWNTFSGISPGTYDTRAFVDTILKLPISVKAYKRKTLVQNNVSFDADLKVGEVYTLFIHALIYSQKIALTDRRMMNYVMCSTGTTKGYNIERDRQIIQTMYRINEYAEMSVLELKSKESYNASLYAIVNTFGVKKYVKLSKYTVSIGRFLGEIVEDRKYRDVLNYFIYKNPRFNKRLVDVLVLYLFPIKYSYRILRLKSFVYNRLKSLNTL